MNNYDEKTYCFIGNGSYGNVYHTLENNKEKNVVKVCEIYQNAHFTEELVCGNIVECIFLQSLKKTFNDTLSDYFPIIKKIKQDDNYFYFTMSYCGPDLDNFRKRVGNNKILEYIPSIMCQLSRILIILKSMSVMHFDIKPANICVDEFNKVRLIDFNLLTHINANSANIEGSSSFTDPYYCNFKNNATFVRDNDMFSCGMVLLFLITGGYVDGDKIVDFTTDSQLYEFLHFDILYEEFPKFREYLDLCWSMISLENRISRNNLYKHRLFNEIRKNYPVKIKKQYFEITNNFLEIDSSKIDSTLEYYYEANIKLFYQMYTKLGIQNFSVFGMKLYLKILTIYPITLDFLKVNKLSIVTIYIVSIIFQQYLNKRELMELSSIVYSDETIQKEVLFCLELLDYNVFPLCDIYDVIPYVKHYKTIFPEKLINFLRPEIVKYKCKDYLESYSYIITNTFQQLENLSNDNYNEKKIMYLIQKFTTIIKIYGNKLGKRIKDQITDKLKRLLKN